MSEENSSLRPTSVAIVGRPNVGKSSLFNYLIGQRRAMVKNQPGVTRDILEEEVEIWNKRFVVYDTGGLTEAKDEISSLIREQVGAFLATVDLVVFILDAKAGLLPEDEDLFRRLQSVGKPFLTVLNKVDQHHDRELLEAEFFKLGVDLVSVSIEQRLGMGEILEWLTSHATDVPLDAPPTGDRFKLALLGKPNAGKSSLVNQLLGKDQVLVSEKAGTTMDSTFFDFNYDEGKYTLIDTAGLRKAAKRTPGLEKISSFKSRDALVESDLVLLIVDILEGVGEQEAKILELALENHKPVLLVANKIDEGEKRIPEMRSRFKAQLENVFHFYNDVPVVFVSALTGKGLKSLFAKIEEMQGKLNTKISTSQLNDFFFRVIRQAPAPVSGTKTAKFYYLTQTQQKPPSFIAFANFPEVVDNGYRRFLSKRLKTQFGLEGIPIRIFVMKKRRS